jgi:acetaldehyde dehydrogenase (acetylating)
MTLGCGAAAGNITGDNVGPQHLINIKRLAYVVREAEEAFETSPESAVESGSAAGRTGRLDRKTITDAVEKYLVSRGMSVSGGETLVAARARSVSEEVVDRFLNRRRAPAPSAPPPGKG